jgi:hypothetical protein
MATIDVRASELAVQLRAYAAGGHARADELLKVAEEFEIIREGFLAEPPTFAQEAFSRTWAKALKLWSLVEAE